MKRTLIWSVVSVFMLLVGSFPLYGNEKLPVFVSILPQKYIVEKIGGNLVDVNVMVLPGASPHTFEPKPRQMVAVSGTKLYFTIGVEFEEAWMEKIAGINPKMTIVAMDDGIQKMTMEKHHHEEEHDHHGERHKEEHKAHEHHHEEMHAEEHADEHHHEEMHAEEHEDEHHHEEMHAEEHEAHEHHHEGLDPHIWLAPSLVKKMAHTALQSLQQVDPANSGVFRKNYQMFAMEIDELDAGLKKALKGKEGLEFIVFHPSWGYFAKEYHLKQVAIEVEGKDPKAAQLKKLIEHARERGIRVVFVQPQFSTRSARLIAKEIKGEVISIDPLAENWGSNMRLVAEKLGSAAR